MTSKYLIFDSFLVHLLIQQRPSSPENLTAVEDKLFFTAEDPINGKELWVSDGTAAGTMLLKNINPGSSSSYPYSLTAVEDKLFFGVYDPVNGVELWVSDGTAAGTHIIDLSGDISSYPFNLIEVNGNLFFSAFDSNTETRALWMLPVERSAIELSNKIVNENVAGDSLVGQLSTTVPNIGDSFVYALVAGDGDTDNAAFSIVGNKLRINSSPDFETKSRYSIRVRTTAQGGLSFEKQLAIAITDLDEFDITTLIDSNIAINSIAESTTNGALVGITASASDADGTNNSITYSLTDNAGGRFAINASTGVVSVANSIFISYESATSHNITIQASSSDGSSSSRTLAIAITDLNEFNVTPLIDSNTAINSIAENATNGALVGITASASDADGSNNTISYSLTDNAGGRFAINASTGVVRVANGSLLNYESATSHNITIQASSSDGSSSSRTLAIAVTNVNEAPTVSNPILNQAANKGTAFNFQLPANTFSDVDASDILTYSATLANGTALPTWLTFNKATRTFSGTPTSGNTGTLSIKVTATDQSLATAEDIFDILVYNIITGTTSSETINGTTSHDKIFGLDGNDTLNGGYGHDILHGGRGSDTLNGGRENDILTGGNGHDVLTGGRGQDRFTFNTNITFAASTIGQDIITDFEAVDDQIVLDKTTFNALVSVVGSGFSVSSEFAVVSSDCAAQTSSALITYNSTNGNLFYNQNGTADGLGSGGLFADLNNNLTLSANDFTIVA